ncbi:Alpha-tocopherol transfer protein-like [Frankliniella fusca]|uniref:Alpha-tocopherol transfer protein-like n=1 Tax=Frankliniella fusca TaxID=407009 RepID=A0AAE1GX69_9NEOP|nr:Alpha-tocopherol transfer protein-like [Frankliniella fusca]
MPSAASPELSRAERPAVVADDHASMDLSEPSDEEMEIARKVLGETEDTKTRTLQELKDIIYERGEVSPYRMDDPFLLRFLRARSFNVDRAHRLLKRYMRFKEENPTYQKGVDPQGFTDIGEADIMTVLPYRDQAGRRIMLFKMGNWDPSKIPIDDIFRATLLVLELGTMEPRTQVHGGVVIFDLQGIGLQHAWQVTPTIAAKVIQLIETTLPMRTVAVHILNESWVFDIIYGLFSPLLADTAIDKVFFHGSDMSSLHEHIDPKHLPARYGGSRHEVPYTQWLDAIRTKNVFRKELNGLGYEIDEDPTLDYY